jgi:arylsulfatase A-like enzyme
VDLRFGPMGKQKCEDTGPLTRKRMETVDQEFLKGSLDFIDRSHQAGKPFFVWFNTTRMHIWTHLSPEWKGKTGLGVYPDGMVELDSYVGQLLKKLDDLGIANNTIVIFLTDNGAEVMTWPDGGTIPFRGEKNTTWEGGFRVPMLLRWPGHIKPNTIANDPMSLQDWLPTLIAATGESQIKEKLLGGYSAGGETYKVHLDGYNFLPYLTGQDANGPRKEFFYFTDDGDLSALRYGNWKILFMVQRGHGIEVWQEQYDILRFPILENLRTDPFERADESVDYGKWRIDHLFLLVPAQAIVAQFLQSFKDFPPRAKPGTFTVGNALDALYRNSKGSD